MHGLAWSVCVGFKICEEDRGHIVRGHTNARSIEA